MTAVTAYDEIDVLAGWLVERPATVRLRGRATVVAAGGLRFAFYGRISTVEYQDEVSSRRWQYDSALDLVAGHGAIVVEFFDVGCSPCVPWHRRLRAGELLAALSDADRGFDAIVVGEYERAFAGGQLVALLSVLRRFGVQLWLPETGGPVDADDPAHRVLLMLLGGQSRREVLRARFRTAAAMQAQAKEQGRFLGGRPPYGYRLGRV
jgi:DNA invertase Pin-like site-specific DNA recombinase